jgi:hypothetical protein
MGRGQSEEIDQPRTPVKPDNRRGIADIDGQKLFNTLSHALNVIYRPHLATGLLSTINSINQNPAKTVFIQVLTTMTDTTNMKRLTMKVGHHKPNCWEYTRCGREPGGSRADDLGVCPAAADRRFDGINEGINGGRACWMIAGTCGSERPECIRANAYHPCTACDFYQALQPNVSFDDVIKRRQIPVSPDNYTLTDTQASFAEHLSDSA